MSKLIIHDWSDQERQVEFVGYNRNHMACLIRNEKGRRGAITLHLPKLFDLRFRDNPIAPDNSPAFAIKRVALHVPACFSSQLEANEHNNPQSNQVLCAKAAYLHWRVVTPHKVWLESKDNDKLSKLLREESALGRQRHTVRAKETDDLIAALRSNKTRRAKELRDKLRDEFTTFGKGENGASKRISIFDATLEMAREGWAGLREKILEPEWAERCGVNLDAIPAAAKAFHVWLEQHAYNKRARIYDSSTQTAEIDVCLNLHPWQWEVLEVCVRYEISFGDGSRCWLDNIEERAVTDPQEIDDFDRLEGTAEAVRLASVRKQERAAEKIDWHSEDFRVIRNLKGEELDLDTTFRALFQILSEQPEQRARFGKLDDLLGDRIRKLEEKDDRRGGELTIKGKKKLRMILTRPLGTTLQQWGVLRTPAKLGREKFLILSAPKIKGLG